jgi:hypothetical protein
LRARTNINQTGQLLGRRFFFYSGYAWGVPLFIVIIGQILDNGSNLPSNVLKPGFGIKYCWFGKFSLNLTFKKKY